jgi:hypothetical protein
MPDMLDGSMFPEKYRLNKQQQKVVDHIKRGNLTVERRRPRLHGLTVEQVAVFNATCKDGSKRIEWHAPDWVAMDRKSYEKLVSAANRNSKKTKLIYDEYGDRS